MDDKLHKKGENAQKKDLKASTEHWENDKKGQSDKNVTSFLIA